MQTKRLPNLSYQEAVEHALDFLKYALTEGRLVNANPSTRRNRVIEYAARLYQSRIRANAKSDGYHKGSMLIADEDRARHYGVPIGTVMYNYTTCALERTPASITLIKELRKIVPEVI